MIAELICKGEVVTYMLWGTARLTKPPGICRFPANQHGRNLAYDSAQLDVPLPLISIAWSSIQASARMPVLHDKFALEEYSAAILASRTCHANSVKMHKLDLGFCMTNENENELCTLIWVLSQLQPLHGGFAGQEGLHLEYELQKNRTRSNCSHALQIFF